MIKKIIGILLGFILFFITMQSSFALETYVGFEILNLEDDPTASCVGEEGYGDQGRIRAISSMPPDFPIYFQLTYASNGTVVWSGDSVEDTDYTIGDIVFLPEKVNLTIGETYKLFFDVDVIRIYLPVPTYSGFTATPDGNYWTAGTVGSFSDYAEEYFTSSSNGCSYSDVITNGLTRPSSLIFISNTRNPAKIIHSCMSDTSSYNCKSQGIFGIYATDTTTDFKINGLYRGLRFSNNGNFVLYFTVN